VKPGFSLGADTCSLRSGAVAHRLTVLLSFAALGLARPIPDKRFLAIHAGLSRNRVRLRNSDGVRAVLEPSPARVVVLLATSSGRRLRYRIRDGGSRRHFAQASRQLQSPSAGTMCLGPWFAYGVMACAVAVIACTAGLGLVYYLGLRLRAMS